MPKPKLIKPKNKNEDKAQSRRFVETARELEADKNPEAFQRAMKSLLPAKKTK